MVSHKILRSFLDNDVNEKIYSLQEEISAVTATIMPPTVTQRAGNDVMW